MTTDVQFDVPLILFADDTTALARLQHASRLEALLVQSFADWHEKVHTGKTHRLAFLPPGASLPPKVKNLYDKTVKLLGAHFQQDGGMDMDTAKRLKAAGAVWAKINAQLPRLGWPFQTKMTGMVLRSTVEASLLYGCEVRTYNSREHTRMRVFMNTDVRGSLRQRLLTMHDDQVTMVDLWQKLGLNDLRLTVEIRQLRYLGHVARMQNERVEKRTLFACVYPEETWRRGKGKRDLRNQYLALLDRLRSFLPEEKTKEAWRTE